jgi:hypothetical protein
LRFIKYVYRSDNEYMHILFQNVGCDWFLDSDAVEDICGVCDGDASTCEFIDKIYSENGEGNRILLQKRLGWETR